MNKQSLSIIFYCYNEEPLISDIIRALVPISKKIAKSRDLEIIFVNDGSTDRTLREMKKGLTQLPGGRIVSYTPNRGVGGALKAGFAAARNELIMTVPGELAFPLEQIPLMLGSFDQETDLLIASYNHPRSTTLNVPAQRLLLSRSLAFLYRLAILFRTGNNPHLHTISSGFRLYRGEIIRNIPFQANDFLANSEIMIRILLKKGRVREEPTTLIWRQKGTKSKMRVKRTILSHLYFLAKIFFNKLNS